MVAAVSPSSKGRLIRMRSESHAAKKSHGYRLNFFAGDDFDAVIVFPSVSSKELLSRPYRVSKAARPSLLQATGAKAWQQRLLRRAYASRPSQLVRRSKRQLGWASGLIFG